MIKHIFRKAGKALRRSRQFWKYQRGAFLSISKMYHFRCFGDFRFRMNLNSRHQSLTNVVKIMQERVYIFEETTNKLVFVNTASLMVMGV